jgi:hypothetical protein
MSNCAAITGLPIKHGTKTNASDRNKIWRAKHSARVKSIAEEFNANAAELKLDIPIISPDNLLPRTSLKGKKRPNFEPPPEIKAHMSPQEITAWKAAERRRRKTMKQRATRARKTAFIKKIEEQLPVLKQKVLDKKLNEGVIESASKSAKTGPFENFHDHGHGVDACKTIEQATVESSIVLDKQSEFLTIMSTPRFKFDDEPWIEFDAGQSGASLEIITSGYDAKSNVHTKPVDVGSYVLSDEFDIEPWIEYDAGLSDKSLDFGSSFPHDPEMEPCSDIDEILSSNAVSNVFAEFVDG